MNKTKLSSVVLASFILMSGMAWAQTSSGTLAVQAELSGSIDMTFVSDAAGVTLTGTGTNAATADFGAVSRFGTPPTHVTQTVQGTTSITVSTPFDVLVNKSNETSANYTLSAVLETTDAVNVWTIDTVTVPTLPSTPLAVTITGAYASDASHTLGLVIPDSETPATISNTIDFLATAN
jgi:hypothetical protein